METDVWGDNQDDTYRIASAFIGKYGEMQPAEMSKRMDALPAEVVYPKHMLANMDQLSRQVLVSDVDNNDDNDDIVDLEARIEQYEREEALFEHEQLLRNF